MSGLIPQRFVEELLDRTDLAELIGSRITLKKSGGNYKACCPFHDERTPSFNVRPDKGFYHCFGCGAHGDAIAFLREYEGLGFTDAVEELAGRQGLEVPYDPVAKEEMRKARTLTSALDEVSTFYQRAMKEHPAGSIARDYLQQRGVDSETAERFAIGFAPPDGDALVRAFDAETRSALIKTRTISDRYGRPRDLFRNRLIFPIRDSRGRTVAFGGRALGDDKAKYINSPESEIYHKSRVIYGLHEAQQANRSLQQLLVVEGYMDVVSLHQFGISWAVAASGTATNQDSIETLLRQSRNLVFAFDGDQAGYRAADRALENVLELLRDGIHIQFLMLPDGEDPDTLVRREGTDAFRARIEQATPLSRFLFDRQSEGLDLELPENRGELRARVEPLLRKMPRSTLREAMWHEMLRLTGRPAWQGRRGGDTGHRPVPAGKPLKVTVDQDASLCAALYQSPGLAEEVLASDGCQQALPESYQLAQWLQGRGLTTRDDILFALATNGEDRERLTPQLERVEHYPDTEVMAQNARDILGKVREKAYRSEHQALLSKFSSLSDLSPEERARLKELQKLIGKNSGEKEHKH